LADMQVAQFFIPKSTANKDRLVTDAAYREYLNGQKFLQDQAAAIATAKAQQKRFFHWFLEFPEIFENGGFDCILGNPPFLGGKKISSKYGDNFSEYLNYSFTDTTKNVDLCGFFHLQVNDLLGDNTYYGLISTDRINNGDSKKCCVDYLETYHGNYTLLKKGVIWPGEASVIVSLLSFNKKRTGIKSIITPMPLSSNDMSFVGVAIQGAGFILQPNEEKALLSNNEDEVVNLFLTAKDLNNNVGGRPSRYIINFGDKELSEIQRFERSLTIINERVKPYRDTVKRKAHRERWWRYGDHRPGLFKAISDLKRVLVVGITSKHMMFEFVPGTYVYDQTTAVIASDSYAMFGILCSSIHNNWALANGADLGGTPRYNPSSCFQTFPLLSLTEDNQLSDISKKYFNLRKSLMDEQKIGLTKFYNLFNTPKIRDRVNLKQCFSEGIVELQQLLILIDKIIIEKIGWHEDSKKWGKAIKLKHDFYEVDYLPENDRVRFTIHPNARKEVLKRLLLLNHERYEEEIKQGLHKKADVEKFYAQKGQPVPAGVVFSDGKAKKKTAKIKKKIYLQPAPTVRYA